MRVKGKTALITGGASGIGLGLAQAFATAGMRIVIADIDRDALARAEAKLAEMAPVLAVPLDVTKPSAWEEGVARAEAAFGGVDVLCNNAGVVQGRLAGGGTLGLADVPESLWRLILETNVTGAFHGIRTVAPRMKARGGGHIVNTSSMAGLIAPPGMAAYAASKYAIVAISEAARAELAPHGIGVSVLCPGGVETNLFANTGALQASSQPGAGAAAPSMTSLAPKAAKMSPLSVGARVLAAIEANELYVFTHPEYAPLVEERFAAIRSAFRATAQPGYSDSPEMLERSRNDAYGAAASRAR